jgi:phosphoserine phosphatase RsbU/P
LGRALECDVHLRDLTISRRHARIQQIDGKFILEDLASGNGTFVNDQGILRHQLKDGDIVRIGSLHFVFEIVSQPTDTLTLSDSANGSNEIEPYIVQRLDANRPILEEATQHLASGASPESFLQMASRLQTIYAVSNAISSILELDKLLPEIIDRMFGVFPKVECAVVLLLDESSDRLVPKAVRRVAKRDDAEIQLSMTVLREVVSNQQVVMSHDALEDSRFRRRRSVASLGIRAVMAAPLVWRGETLGVLYLDSLGIGAFTPADLELLTGIAGQAAVAVGNAKLHKQLLKRQRLEQDLRLAERIQQSFLPKRTPEVPGFSFAAQYTPAYDVGGDFYDFVLLPAGKIGIVVGDVSGKGVSAALYMARMTRDLRYYALAEPDPAHVLNWLNRTVADSGQDDIFVTMIYVVLDCQRGSFQYANAGHMSPAIREASPGGVRFVDDPGGVPLGVFRDTLYETGEEQLSMGDAMLLYSDGLVEAMNAKREMYGMGRLEACLKKTNLGKAADLLTAALSDCRSHVGDASPFDDTTVVCISRDRVMPN